MRPDRPTRRYLRPLSACVLRWPNGITAALVLVNLAAFAVLVAQVGFWLAVVLDLGFLLAGFILGPIILDRVSRGRLE